MPRTDRHQIALVAIATTLLLFVAGLALATRAGAEETARVVAEGDKVSIEFTLSLTDGTVADSNVGGAPLVYQQGAGQILPALERQLSGLAVGDTKDVSLTATEGYGESDPTLLQNVPIDQIPADSRVVGMQLIAQGAGGQQRPVRVHEVKADEVVLDLNHPLAGEALRFAIKIVAIE